MEKIIDNKLAARGAGVAV